MCVRSDTNVAPALAAVFRALQAHLELPKAMSTHSSATNLGYLLAIPPVSDTQPVTTLRIEEQSPLALQVRHPLQACWSSRARELP